MHFCQTLAKQPSTISTHTVSARNTELRSTQSPRDFHTPNPDSRIPMPPADYSTYMDGEKQQSKGTS